MRNWSPYLKSATSIDPVLVFFLPEEEDGQSQSHKEFSNLHYLRVLLSHLAQEFWPTHSVHKEATTQRGQEQSEHKDLLTFPGEHPLGESHWFHSIKYEVTCEGLEPLEASRAFSRGQ